MYLSRIELDIRRPDTKRGILYPSIIHGAIENSFEIKEERKLWRLDELGGRIFLLVLSEKIPDFTHLGEQFGTFGEKTTWQSKDCSAFLENLANGQKCRFRLCANPVHRTKRSVKLSDPNAGVIRAHVTQDQQCQWLISRAESCGFSLDLGEKYLKDGVEYWTHPSFDVTGSAWRKLNKGTKQDNVRIRQATFEGVLTITDIDIFRDKLIHGIGRGKAYGCGMMTIIPL